jgi:hypothetical protein
MAKFEATYSFNVRRFIKREIEAETPEQAADIARASAWQFIDSEIVTFQNSDGFGDVDKPDAWLFVDDENGDEIADESLPEPRIQQPGEMFGTDPETGQPTVILGESA